MFYGIIDKSDRSPEKEKITGSRIIWKGFMAQEGFKQIPWKMAKIGMEDVKEKKEHLAL